MKTNCCLQTFFVLICMGSWAMPLPADDFIWVEGENAKTKSVRGHRWYDSIKTNMLSGGKHLSHWNGGQAGKATYVFSASDTKPHAFWVRTNPIGSKLSYKLNDGPWVPIDISKKEDVVNLAADDKPDMRYLAWVPVGAVKLKRGPNTIAFKLHSGNNNHGMLDCFVFTPKPFFPSGARKPGEKLNLTEPGRWSFEPDHDAFKKDAWLDLRNLNETIAGESGYIRATEEGDFILGNGKPVRFWAANTSVYHRPGTEALQRHCKHIAKRGVNMVRFHGALQPKTAGSKITDVDLKQIDECQKLVAIAKREGIYTTFSPFWGTHAKYQTSWKIPGHTTGNLAALLFWDKTMQAGYKAWVRALLTRPNPYDKNKTPLGKDAALAIFQIQNEDSMLFWTMQSVKGREKRRLDALYSKWLKDHNKTTPPTLNLKLWELDKPTPHHKDTIRFLTETMRTWNLEFARFLREDLGCKALINAGNWRTANEIKLLDHERWSYTANEVLGANRYVGGVHINPTEGHKAGYLVSKGDLFTDHSKLLQPRGLATNLKQVPGRPMIISESTWVPPLGYQSEAPFLVAAYSSLTGVDIYYWFALNNVGYDPTIQKWQAANPTMMGGWPAAALMFRRGYIQKGRAVVQEQRALKDMWDLATPIIAEDQAFDPNRDKGNFGKLSNIKQGVDPLAFLVGPVEVVYTKTPVASKVVDLSKYIDHGAKKITSVTGQLQLNYGSGLCTLDTPKAQGATGFLKKAGKIKLGAVTIDGRNEFATVLVVSMDGRDLTDSAKVLVQITTQCRPYGWKTAAATFQSKDKKKTFQGKRIVDTGTTPWNVVNTNLSIRVANSKLKHATILDINGYSVQKVKATSQGGMINITPPPHAMYLVLHP